MDAVFCPGESIMFLDVPIKDALAHLYSSESDWSRQEVIRSQLITSRFMMFRCVRKIILQHEYARPK